MRLTKFGHACIRIEHEATVLVLDPGVFTAPEAVDGATAVLLTHEHPDHAHADNLRRTDAPIFTIDAVAAKLADGAADVAERTTVVSPGQHFDAGLPIRAVGEMHAVIHPEIPRVHNSGFLIDVGGTRVFHPGDALTGPDEPIDLLCCVVSAPWSRSADLIDFARDVGAPRNLAIHDKVYSEAGLGIVDGQMNLLLPDSQSYTRLPDGADL